MSTILQAMLTSWPFWIAVWLTVLLVLFRSNIRGLIDRITGISKTGILAPSKETQTTPGAATPTLATGGEDLMAELDNPYARELTKKLTEEWERRGLNKDPARALPILTRYLAVVGMTADFENIEGLMWGSQVDILTTLNPLSVADGAKLLPHYEAAAARYSTVFASYPFEQYMDFLVKRGLVTREGDSFAITEKGRAFLMWRIFARKGPRAG
jgi:hypothetical protein